MTVIPPPAAVPSGRKLADARKGHAGTGSDNTIRIDAPPLDVAAKRAASTGSFAITPTVPAAAAESITQTDANAPPAALSEPGTGTAPPADLFNASIRFETAVLPPVNAGTGLIINLVWDTQALLAPQSFRDSIQAAANLLQATIQDNITVNIRIGYGEIDGTPLNFGSAAANPTNGVTRSYQTLRSLLASHSTSADDTNSVNALPDTTSLNGQSFFFVPSSEAKSLGLISAIDATVDGSAGFATDISSNLLVGVALHEITHAMGRIPGASVLSLFRYSSPGNHVFSSQFGVTSYFSIDGGNVAARLADFGVHSDVSDFLNPPASDLTPNDPFDEFYSSGTLQTLTSLDLRVMDVLGFQIACYCRGTLIRTDTGEVPVEDLAIGDKVMTLSGMVRPIKWIGRRSYAGRFISGKHAVLPIRVKAGALDPGVPRRDLLVSPEHALLADGLLVPARLLVNGLSIVREGAGERVDYIHIELDRHDVIFAEGAPAETYVDCDNRGMFHNAAEFRHLYPDDRRGTWQFCAPRIDPASVELGAIRARILARAVRVGYATTAPDLHLIVGGEIVRPLSIRGLVYRFRLAPGSRAVWLASRSSIPAESAAASQDTRRLGVAVERLVLRGSERRVECGPDSPALGDGFHEPELGHRWTDGMGRLRLETLRRFPAGAVLDVHIAETDLCYGVEPAMPAARKAGGRARSSAA